MNNIVALILIPLLLYVLPILLVFFYALYIVCCIDYKPDAISEEQNDCEACEVQRNHKSDYLSMILTPKNMPKMSFPTLQKNRNIE